MTDYTHCKWCGRGWHYDDEGWVDGECPQCQLPDPPQTEPPETKFENSPKTCRVPYCMADECPPSGKLCGIEAAYMREESADDKHNEYYRQ